MKHQTRVKICGIRTPAAIAALRPLAVDYVGFVFAKSKRRVTPAQAAELTAQLRSGEANTVRPQTVGVFVGPAWAELTAAVTTARLDVVQLHGQETPEFCRMVKSQLHVPVIKVFSVTGNADADDICDRMEDYVQAIDAVMLDTHDPVYGGGTGKTFRWELLPAVKTWTEHAKLPLFVAGGIDADNVRELIDRYAPDSVDISSGVETDGRKDPDKITKFVKRVKS